jgi:hypothetical protein
MKPIYWLLEGSDFKLYIGRLRAVEIKMSQFQLLFIQFFFFGIFNFDYNTLVSSDFVSKVAI